MDKLNEIYQYILGYVKSGYDVVYPYVKYAHDYWHPHVMELYNYLYTTILANKELFTVVGLLILYLYIKSRRPKVLRKRKYKKARLASKKRFYNTGIRLEVNFKDIIKIKVRLADYCDKKGVRYCYLFNIKLFGLELLRVKYIDQKGAVYKRKVTFRS